MYGIETGNPPGMRYKRLRIVNNGWHTNRQTILSKIDTATKRTEGILNMVWTWDSWVHLSVYNKLAGETNGFGWFWWLFLLNFQTSQNCRNIQEVSFETTWPSQWSSIMPQTPLPMLPVAEGPPTPAAAYLLSASGWPQWPQGWSYLLIFYSGISSN